MRKLISKLSKILYLILLPFSFLLAIVLILWEEYKERRYIEVTHRQDHLSKLIQAND